MKQYRPLLLIVIALLIGWTLLIQEACGQQLKQIQKGTANNQIPVTNGYQYTQVYRNALPYILDTLGVRDSIYLSNDTIFLKNGSGFVVLDTIYAGGGGSDTTQYLNPYVIGPDTVGFYLTVAVDTVLFVNTIDTAAITGIDSTTIIGGWGIDATESPLNTWNMIVDSSQVATQYDLTALGDNQTLSIDSTSRVFTVSISGGNSVKFKDTGGADSTTVVNSYGTTITESPANQWNIKVDSSKFATTYDISQVGGGASPFFVKISSGTLSVSSTSQTEWSGNFRDTIDATGYYKVELYASYITSNTATGASFSIYNSSVTDAIGILEVSNTNGTSTSSLSRKSVQNMTSEFINGTGATNTTDKQILYGQLNAYFSSGAIIIPKFASEDTNAVVFQSGARLIITKLF